MPKIRSLRSPESKMSKSDPNPLSRIELTDSPEDIKEKVKKAVTDCTSQVTYDPENRPGVANLIDIHMAFSDLFAEEICEDAYLKCIDTGAYKERVSEAVIEQLTPIRQNVIRLQADKSYLEKILAIGQEKARSLAAQTIKEVKEAIGLR